ncbi:hypothetical protein V5799_021022 [Amblyomma americanum]|uniref:Uncharacterized protein n=1 Tax=Amblyomma americanum TaxID=6943 RepID=A0AAQ4FPM2_AMBAM
MRAPTVALFPVLLVLAVPCLIPKSDAGVVVAVQNNTGGVYTRRLQPHGRGKRDAAPTDQAPSSPKGLDMSPDVWHTVPPYLKQVLTSIDDRLRGMDAFGSALRLTRLDFSLEQVLRKLDAFDSRLGRLEAKLDLRLEKMEEALGGGGRKDSASASAQQQQQQGAAEAFHLSRRFDMLGDKLNNKLAFLETKLDMRADRLANKLELLERDLQDASEDALEKMTRGDEARARLHADVSRLADLTERAEAAQRQAATVLRVDVADVIKRADAKMDLFSQEMLTANNMLRAMQQQQQNATQQQAACQGTSPDAPSWEQVTNLTELVEKMVRVGGEQLREIDSDVESYTRKVINGIYELRRTTDELVRGAFQDTVEQGNRTRVLVREEFRKLHEQIEPLPLIEPRLSFLSEGLEKRIVELGATVDHSFATLLVAQNSFISSCHRIQEEEVQLYELLERIILEMRNRSLDDTQRISDELQGHSHEVAALLRGAVSAVFAAGNKTLAEVRSLLADRRRPEPCKIQPPCAQANDVTSNRTSTPLAPSHSVTASPSGVGSPAADTRARFRSSDGSAGGSASANSSAATDYEYYDDVLK